MQNNFSIRNFGRKDTKFSSSSGSNIPDKLPPRYSSFSSGSSALSRATTIVDDGVDDPMGPLGFNLLYSPSQPLIDFVFVHGLGGGSRKTWSKTSSITHYWPQEWLPKDPAFKSVRVHSFGYNSDWIKGKDNCLNINHFGKSFLAEMRTSPYLGNSETPIVLIGHSMGGLVIKRAYMLARQDAAYETLANRFHTIYFLATPHRGCSSASLLNGILQVAYSSKAYISDLKRSSEVIQTINDEFRHYSVSVDLWSFYETQELSIGGVLRKLIVDPDSAVLGYREEKQMPMNADHRSICKFETIRDPNYLILRNALASTVSGISKIATKSKEKLWRSEVMDLEKYLGVSEKLEDDLITAEDARISGTCEWLATKDTYLRWKNFAPDGPSVLWINGKPAAGKSVLAGYAIDQLKRSNMDCSYFFFRYDDKSKSRLGACLRSIAFQMACTNTQVRETLLEMQKDGIRFDKDNERTIWRKLFLSGIFQTEFPKHYWVIDGLDECVNSSPFFDLMLAKLDESVPLRILITSRESSELEKQLMTLGAHRFQSERISEVDTLPDIKLLVEAKAKSLIVKDDDHRAALVEKILLKSQGSFLWTVLVLNELSKSYGEEEVNQVLDEVPRDMEPLYQRTLELMSQATRGKKLTNAILIWATCATRPLTTKELDGALKLDIQENFLKLEESIVALCGQLVTVDKFGKVQMVHETAREFLFNEDLESEFAINKRVAHTRIAKTCLTYLTGQEMNPPRSGRRVSTASATGLRTEFSSYACAAFSSHLAKADPLANDILILVDKFLKSNVLSWIEVIAQTQDLTPLISTAKNLRTYLNACSAERSPLDRRIQTIKGWTTDLIRIAAKFADALITSPSAIYSLILPFCPTQSTVYKIATLKQGLSVVGLSNTQWDDRLSCVDFQQGQTSALCYGDEFFAVGLTTGIIALYHAIYCREYKVLYHGEAVRFLQFKSKSDLLASCGMKNIRIWDIRSGETIHNFEAPHRSICLIFDQSLLIAASIKNYLASWDLDDNGVQRPNRLWNNSGEQLDTPLRRQPCAISISVSHKMLAVAYSGQSITLWDLEEDTYYGTCGKKLTSGETSTHVVSALVFNPNVNINLLAASYLDGELVLLDPFVDRELESSHENCHTLAASPDGRLIAGSAGSGTIQIYEFDTLRLLYRVKSSNFYIKQLAFSRDSLHFADIRGSQCNIWEPAVLLRDMVADDSSDGSTRSVFEAVALDTKVKISAIVLHPMGEVVFCGKGDGSVCLYDLKTGAQLQTLYCHKSLVHTLTWWPQSDIIMSVDASNVICAWNVRKTQQKGWVAEKMLFQSRLDCGKSIIQVLPGEAAGKFVLSTRESDHLWSIGGQQEDIRTKIPGIRKWIQHQQSPFHIICIECAAARIYSWSDWSEISYVPISLDTMGLQLQSVTSYMSGHRWRVLLELSELDGSPSTRSMHLLDAASFSIGINLAMEDVAEAANTKNDSVTISIKEVVPAKILSPLFGPQLAALAHHVAHIIGRGDNGRLIFLDTHSWVCSADLEDLDNSSVPYIRHFFVPYDWFSGIRDVISAVIKRDILFARNDNIAIIKGGLEYVEKVQVRLDAMETKGKVGLLTAGE